MTHYFTYGKWHLVVPGMYSCQITCVGICWSLTTSDECCANSDAASKMGEIVTPSTNSFGH